MNLRTRSMIRCAAALALGFFAALAGCSDSQSSSAVDAPVIVLPDAPRTDARPAIDGAAGPDGSTADCVSGTPVTNEDLLNACTTAQKLVHDPALPLRNSDGSLPPCPGCSSSP